MRGCCDPTSNWSAAGSMSRYVIPYGPAASPAGNALVIVAIGKFSALCCRHARVLQSYWHEMRMRDAHAAAVPTAAALLGVLDWCLNRGPIRRAIERRFSAVSPTPQKLRQNVYLSNIRIIGVLHLAIQVSSGVVPGCPRCLLFSRHGFHSVRLICSCRWRLRWCWTRQCSATGCIPRHAAQHGCSASRRATSCT